MDPGSLPIDPLVPDIVESLTRTNSLVIEAPPGAGKTTRVPPALLRFGGVLVLEPRRLAARLAARRVAAERGERLGETVGYQVRFEDVSGPQTVLRFVTEGVLTRRLLGDPALQGVQTVVLDEFHERHLEGDLALALLVRLQRTERPDLRLVVMSATMDAAPVAEHLDDCPVLRAEGKRFDLEVRHSPVSPEPLEGQVAAAVLRLLRDGLEGDILVFLPGAAEIRRAIKTCEPIARRWDWLALPLHGDLSPEEQDLAVLPLDKRKVIFSTNVAESSVTIEGVRAVIDSGLARMAAHSPWTGLPGLHVERVSKASAIQRAGRAGRTGPGKVIRLYPVEDFHRRPEHHPPEVERLELSQMCLMLHAMSTARPTELPWLNPPPQQALEAAEGLLRRLGAVDVSGRLTGTGHEMVKYPLHPRLARLMAESRRRGVAGDGCAVAGLLSAGARMADDRPTVAASDLFVLLDQAWNARTRRVVSQVARLAGGKIPGHQAAHSPETDEQLLKSILTAFPDRVARRSRPSNQVPGKKQNQFETLLLASGGSALLSPASVVRHEFLVAIDVEERRERGLPLVRLASSIEPEWLLDLYPDRISEKAAVEWNRKAERVEAVSALLYDELVIEESRSGAVDPQQAARLLAEKAWEAGVERFADMDEVREFLSRVAFGAQHGDLPALGDHDVKAALEDLCVGLRGFAELRAAAGSGGLLRALQGRLTPDQRATLNRLAPPRVASRLQDFFGMNETPRVAGGREPVVIHLLAPNQRAVQTTSDLAGFWERHYPALRRQLMRRYPKHAWPEKPTTADAKKGPR